MADKDKDIYYEIGMTSRSRAPIVRMISGRSGIEMRMVGSELQKVHVRRIDVTAPPKPTEKFVRLYPNEQPQTPESFKTFLDELKTRSAELVLTGIVRPERKVPEGQLIKATSPIWGAIAEQLGSNWEVAFKIPPDKWEEIIAGAFDRAGFDEVILTHRSGDHGRDIIAIRKGVGSIKIIGSVKAYRPGHLVGYDDVRALLGVMSGERDASKGLIATTSDFPPRIMKDPYISPFLPTRLELMNGNRLREWLVQLSRSKPQ